MKEIDEYIKSTNIWAVYPGGEMSTTMNLKEGWVMLIDIGRGRNTITSNPTTTPAINFAGQKWEMFNHKMDGGFLVVDDDMAVFYETMVSDEDFEAVKAGDFYAIISLENRCYMNKNGEFKELN
jgi:hypothetical protein